MDVSKLVRENIANLAPYSTARDEYKGEIGVYLDANENPYDNGINRYPDPHQFKLKERIAAVKGLKTENLFLGNGSDEAIDLIFRIFCCPAVDEVIAITPSYGMYKVAANTNDIKLTEVKLKEDYSLDLEAIISAITPSTKAVFLCSPNNPSGNLLSKEDIIKLIELYKVLVVVDEAYIDFADDEGFVPLLEKYPNVIVLQTLSKAWGMAGLRVGMAIASTYIIGLMNKVKYPYNINCLAQEKAFEMLSAENVEKSRKELAEIIAERKRVMAELENIASVVKIYPSDANFILVKMKNANETYNSLIENKIIVRNRSSVVLCDSSLRISIGTPEENDKLIKELRDE